MAMTYSDFFEEWASSDPYIHAHTSGSTGNPKNIRLLKSDMRASAAATNSRFGIGRTSRLAIPLSADYIAGKMMAVRALVAGCSLLELPVSNRIELHEPVDLLSVVPTQVESLLRDCDNSLVRNVIVGGARLDDSLRKALAAAPMAAFCSYGMTETCSHVALADVDDPALIYHAMPGIGFSADSRGCLCIHSRSMSFGTLRTNDIVDLLDSSSFRWLGRADNVINSGGLKILPEEIEALLAPLLSRPYYIVGAPDEKWGEVAVLVVECEPGEIETIRRAVDCDGLGKKKPRRIVAVDSLPRTSNGKIRRILPLDN